MSQKADLHIHTYHSDGIYSPTEIIDKAIEKGISIISITDHDSTNALPEAIEYGREKGVEVIPGVEISTDINNVEVHLLGYFINYTDEEFNKYLTFFREERLHRARRMVQKLNNLGMNVNLDDVLEEAKFSAIGRPHIATVMLKQGFVSDYYEAFDKYLGNNAPAFERKIHVSPQSALKLISDAGGLAFVAHPGNIKESILIELIEAGLDGIEVIHPSHQEHHLKFYRGIVSEYCLLDSGGSDFHGGFKNDDDNFGSYLISSSKIEAMRKMLIKDSA
jgi:3',5'-nucleoside bisphosphate phosphatase